MSIQLFGNGTISGISPWAYRNRIINGDMRVQQRGSLAYTTGVAGYSGPDRFRGNNNGSAGGQFTQSANTMTINGVTYASCRQTVNTVVSSLTSTNLWSGINTVIEGYNCYDLVNQSFTISFWFKSNVVGIYSVGIQDGVNSYSYVTTFSFTTANTPQYVTVAIPASAFIYAPNSSAAGLSMTIGTLNTGSYQTPTLNSWLNSLYYTASSNVNWGATIGNFIEVTMLQLEAGTVATPFEFLRFTDQLILCQRYYCKTFNVGTPAADFVNGAGNMILGVGGGGYYGINWKFPVTMRTSPTVTTYSPSNGNAGQWRNGGNAASSLPSVSGTSDEGTGIFLSSTPYGGGSDAYYIQAAASAEL